MQETPLTGGQMTSVVKIGDTVHRKVNEWTPAVHQLLKHLEVLKFEGVPRVLGMDMEGREILSFLDGEAGYFDSTRTVPDDLWSDEVLVEAARFLRRYHDATTSFVALPDTRWQFSRPQPEVVCHNDFAPWNSVFVDRHLSAIIDFDTAGPGARLDDIAYAVYSFAPLFRPEKCKDVGLNAPLKYSHKLQLFCNAYGREYCDSIVDAIIKRIEGIRDWITEEAAKGDARFQRKIDEGHVANYDADIAFLCMHKKELQQGLE